MCLPGFAAEASFFKNRNVYRGHSAAVHTAPSVLAASSCTDVCDLGKDVCEAACGFDALCIAGCFLGSTLCQALCSDAGGTGLSGWPGSGLCCPSGTKCCGQCVKRGGARLCDGFCVARNQPCVV